MTALIPTSAAATPATSRRITGIDMARALAILGMVMVHFGPFSAPIDTVGTMLYRFSYGRASVLFVMLAGVGISMLFRTRTTDQAWLQVVWRAIVFFPLGMFLQGLDTPVAVILQFYAAYYLVGGLGAMLPTRVLAGLTVLWAVLGPVLFTALADPSLAGRGTATVLTDPISVVSDLAWSGFYPLVTWTPPLLVGLLIGRADLRDTATRVVLAVGGAGVAGLAYGGAEVARSSITTAANQEWLITEGHTGTPLNVIGATAVAVAVLGTCLLLAGWLPRICWPLVATGQMALTVYVGHLFLLDWAPTLFEARSSYGEATLKVGRFYVVAVLFCVLWRHWFARGPLEYLLGLPFSRRTRTRDAGPAGTGPLHGAPPGQGPSHHTTPQTPTTVQGEDRWQPVTRPPSGTPPPSSRPAPRPSSPSAPTSSSASGTRPPSS
ncbi:DUF418 domain-containing protein [Euzebya tangerina]|uniref:DUF418 domain-containing protein n=1 Tax=Euzebya tangerina TaxID=591198 RepID=UPI0013C33A54|nr:DUF418 domain-containing protein [Euzebya tangerina]